MRSIKIMKKLISTFVLTVCSFAALYAYTVSRDVTLSNEEYGQKLFLYTNGNCVVTLSNGARGTGTYDLKNNGQIYISWDNGSNQQGSYTKDNNGLKSVYIEGVTYTVGRRVVSRSR